MKNRNVFAVFALPFITFGIYGLYWMVKTKGEMNSLGAQIPTAWLIIIPFVNIWWYWKYCEGVDQITSGKLSTPIAFLVIWLLGSIGYAIVQNDFNNIQAAPAAAPVPAMAAAPAVNYDMNNTPTPQPAPMTDHSQPVATAAPVEPQIVEPAPSPIVFETPAEPIETATMPSEDFSTNDNSSES
jgi:Domain of unknown function (DUF4234)